MGIAATWTDTTSYRRGERDTSAPREWTWKGKGISVLIHRHIHYPPDTWLVTCHDLSISARPLKAKAVVDAQHEALSTAYELLVSLELQARKAMGE